ncbi:MULTISPECIES: amino acid ABC transporter permease [unclassified Agarivorans]|uniref:amino acid ABC transporter permease n=1 Tax=unclassified Agarivorans TaxID=2636026 RepID=UPI0026E365F8|nr:MULTISPECIES: amino acid ABC transporter permease [unclassified Agarivorans]MDO6685915.1 amino acid ABC transporter permease [Agarivorans sp. 3_MG-2023]MDO6713947.1 amino acid ABC transporter permease [Agarivorans sp. 2_MG-2023]
MSVHQFRPDLAPPNLSVGFVGWLKKNLFSSWLNSLFTLFILYLIIPPLASAIQWAFLQADWIGDSREACTSDGACWVFVADRFSQLIYGFYPSAERWRVDLVFVTFLILIAALVYEKTPHKPKIALFSLFIYPIIVFFLLLGDSFGLPKVETHQWGGLMLTLVLAIVGIVAALPIGILLALGRRSHMPIVRSFCTIYIEFWRAVPLITVLFMASVMLPLFVGAEVDFNKLARAMIGIIMFQSAYMAEVIRGGLQAIPKGQYEAGEALSLSYWQSMGLIILPQALKITIPSIVNTFIALFKDTSLVLVIGLFDLLAIGQSALADPAWLGFSTEMYVFIAFVFWVFCFSMSRYSIHLEKKLHTGH